MKIPKDMRPMAKIARRAGWTITMRHSGHLRWTRPDDRFATTGSTPSDRWAARNCRRDLRRMGLGV
jgi:hypothetical protein